MTYNHTSFNTGLGLPSSGFASRGKQNNVKRLSVSTSKIGGSEEPSLTTPRTSRGHLLAGLRTAKSPGMPPASAPPTQLQQPGLGDSYYAKTQQQQYQEPPKTAAAASFSNNNYNQTHGKRPGHMYTPSQVLAPPSIEIGDATDYSQMDPALYDELVRTNQYLAEQQLRLQQQLITVQNQFRNLNVGQQGYAQPNQMSMYQQQLQQGVQPIVEPVPNQPGVYLVYNPLTGQQSFFVDQQAQQQAMAEQYLTGVQLSASPPPPTPTFRAEVSPPEETRNTSPKNLNNPWRSQSPPKSTTPPRDEHTPLPPPSATAFRPGHRKNNLSLANTTATAGTEGPRTGGLRSAGFPNTPMTGTFGPGQGREGEHPTRQPRGPPSLEELVAKPTSKHEGSKNFATRQRRRALNNLVRAGVERRATARGEDFGTPTSEHEITFSISDTDSVRSGSASLSGRPSLGNLKSTPAAIGSERASLKDRSRERGSVDSYTASSVSSEESFFTGGKLVEIKVDGAKEDDKRKGSLAVLANAERRRSLIY